MRPPTIEMSAPSQPLINRTTKPAMEIKKMEEIPIDQPVTYPVPLPRSTIPKMPSIEKETDKIITEPSPVNRGGPIPKVDRNLKINAMVKYLQDEETLVEKHLAMTENQLEKEKEWDRVRSEREASANNEITYQLQERENQMLEMFNKMENDNKEQVLFLYLFSKTELFSLCLLFLGIRDCSSPQAGGDYSNCNGKQNEAGCGRKSNSGSHQREGSQTSSNESGG